MVQGFSEQSRSGKMGRKEKQKIGRHTLSNSTPFLQELLSPFKLRECEFICGYRKVKGQCLRGICGDIWDGVGLRPLVLSVSEACLGWGLNVGDRKGFLSP